MVDFFSTLLRLFFQVFRSRRTILSEIALLKKENEILARKIRNLSTPRPSGVGSLSMPMSRT